MGASIFSVTDQLHIFVREKIRDKMRVHLLSMQALHSPLSGRLHNTRVRCNQRHYNSTATRIEQSKVHLKRAAKSEISSAIIVKLELLAYLSMTWLYFILASDSDCINMQEWSQQKESVCWFSLQNVVKFLHSIPRDSKICKLKITKVAEPLWLEILLLVSNFHYCKINRKILLTQLLKYNFISGNLDEIRKIDYRNGWLHDADGVVLEVVEKQHMAHFWLVLKRPPGRLNAKRSKRQGLILILFVLRVHVDCGRAPSWLTIGPRRVPNRIAQNTKSGLFIQCVFFFK